MARFARWTFEALSTSYLKQSEPFQMGLWTWYVAVEKDQTMIKVEAISVGVKNLVPHVSPDLLDRHTKAEAANDQLTKELEERTKLVNTLFMNHHSEKQVLFVVYQ
ncbi:hypothetical protein AgCh_001432 [Apium graveolens]